MHVEWYLCQAVLQARGTQLSDSSCMHGWHPHNGSASECWVLQLLMWFQREVPSIVLLVASCPRNTRQTVHFPLPHLSKSQNPHGLLEVLLLC